MKKIFAYIILACILNFLNPFICAFATQEIKYKDIKETNLSIKSMYKWKMLVEKNTKKPVLPIKYEKIKKVKYKNHIFIRAEKEYPYIVSIYNPNDTFKNFIKTYYEINNNYQNIKFENYPEKGILIYKKKNKQGIIIAENKVLHVLNPQYDINTPDSNSIVGRMLNISFAPYTSICLKDTEGHNRFLDKDFYALHRASKPIIIPYRINEEINIKNNKITVTYKDISAVDDNKFIFFGQDRNKNEFYLYNNKFEKYKNIKQIKEPLVDYLPIIENIDKLYEVIKTTSNFEFINYPKTAYVITDNKIYIFDKNNKQEIKNDYEDIFLFDKNLLINQFTGLKLSYQNPNNIIVKKANKWGVINTSQKVIIPFEYDAIYPVGDNITEKIENIEDHNATKLIVNFVERKKNKELFFVKKSDNYGVIDSNNNIIVPFEQINYMENEDIEKIVSQTKNTNKKKSLNKVGRTIEKAIFYTMVIILFPVAIICPPIGWVLMCGFEIY